MLLIVEDHADTREALILLLRQEGYEATGSGCGPSALEALRTCKPRLIILDCHMPGMSGLDVLRIKREDSRISDIPVIVFSAASGPEEAEALRLGAKAFIRKASLDWAALLQAIRLHANHSGPG
jgi:CheY-like chemotaxis protein